MRTVIYDADEALRLHEVGGYLSLRAGEPIAAVVRFGAEIPAWITFVAPLGKIWGMRLRISDVHVAREGAVLRDGGMQKRIIGMFPGSALGNLAPPPVMEACASDPSESVHAELSGYYHLAPMIAAGVEPDAAIQRVNSWIASFPREAMASMADDDLEAAGWFSPRSESQRAYALLLFAAPSVMKGMRGPEVDQIIASLENAQGSVSLDRLQLDPRFLHIPKFSLGLTSMAMASDRLQPRLLEVADLRAKLVQQFDSPLLFDEVAAERLRMDEDYKDFVSAEVGTRIRASLDAYLSRWREPLAKVVIV